MKLAILFFTTIFSMQAYAEWALDKSGSSLSFVSVKNGIIAEVHTFKALSGRVEKNGKASLEINLDSVDTLIPIRDERMRKLLFATDKYPTAEVEVELDSQILNQLKNSSATKLEVFGNVTIKGQSQRVGASVIVSGSSDGGVTVSTAKPVLIAANQFDLISGIEALREVAGLSGITPVVPVTFSLRYKPAAPRPTAVSPASGDTDFPL